MKRILTLFLSAASVLLFSGFYSVKDIDTTGLNLYYLTSKKWDLVEVEVGGKYYTDSVSTNLDIKFSTNGTFRVYNDTIDVPWQFQDALQQKIVVSPGTSDQQVWNIRYLDLYYLVYDFDYTVNGTTYNYIYKFKSIEVPVEE